MRCPLSQILASGLLSLPVWKSRIENCDDAWLDLVSELCQSVGKFVPWYGTHCIDTVFETRQRIDDGPDLERLVIKPYASEFLYCASRVCQNDERLSNRSMPRREEGSFREVDCLLVRCEFCRHGGG